MHRAWPERIAAGAAHRVPIGHRKAEMVFHRLAFDHFLLVVVVEGEQVLALGAFELDLLDFGKCCHGMVACGKGKFVTCGNPQS